MLRYNPADISQRTTDYLAGQQKKVNRKRSRQTKYAEAKQLFKLKNNAAFREIRSNLEAVAPAGDCCMYCERDRHREIEHIQPQRHYPELAFSWENYVLACSFCNQDLKNDRFAVIDDLGNLIEFDRFSLPFDLPIPTGTNALINPRREDPLDFFELDLETGVLVVIATDAPGVARAEFTIKLLRLNEDAFLRARRAHRDAFLQQYSILSTAIDAGDRAAENRARNEIQEFAHPTVLAELKRQGRVPKL